MTSHPVRHVYRCPGCGSPASGSGVPCEYCNTLTVEYLEPVRSKRKLRKDFGFSETRIQWSVILAVNVLSMVASFLNGRSFLDSTAVIVLWFLLIPLVTLITGFLKHSPAAVFLPFLSLLISIGGITFLITVIKMNRCLHNWRYIDDSLGLGAVTGSVAAGAYLAGVFLHWFARYARA